MAAFDALYARYEGPLFGFIKRQLNDATEAEDVLHETFIAVLKNQDAARSFRAWVYQTALHACLNRVRAKRRAGLRAEPDGATSVDPQLALETHQRGLALQAAVARLPQGLGAVYHLRARGLSYEELAQVLEVPVGTVKSRMHELLTRLRQEMKTS